MPRIFLPTAIILLSGLLSACTPETDKATSNQQTKELVAGELFRKSQPGDRAQYFLLDRVYDRFLVRTTHKRVSKHSTGYTHTEINCGTGQYRVLGYSDISPNNIVLGIPGKWTNLISGSSKSSLANYVCY